MKLKLAALGMVALFAIATLSFAGPRRFGAWTSGCGPGGCGPAVCGPGGCDVTPAMRPQTALRDRWEADDNEAALFRNGVQIGSWHYAEAYWRDYDARNDRWGQKSSTPPAEPPARANVVGKKTAERIVKPVMPEAEEFETEPIDVTGDLTDANNFGVNWDKISPHQATFNGRKIGCERAYELIGKQIPDDKGKFRFTVIGTQAEQKAALTQFAALEPEIRDRCNTWCVAADHWSLRDGVTGEPTFKTQGTPVIYFQAPDGKVLHRQDDATDFPTALRKAIKGYDAAKDPDLRKQEPKKPGEPASSPIHPAIPIAALGAAALYFSLRKPRSA